MILGAESDVTCRWDHRVLENNERGVLGGGALWSRLGQTAHQATLSLQMRDQGVRWVTYKVASHSTAAHLPQAGGVNCSLKIPRVWLRLTRKTETSLHIWDTDA